MFIHANYRGPPQVEVGNGVVFQCIVYHFLFTADDSVPHNDPVVAHRHANMAGMPFLRCVYDQVNIGRLQGRPAKSGKGLQENQKAGYIF
jgi:hypothetical protein